MNEKNYVVIAEIIESNRGNGVEYTLDNIAGELANYFKQQNPRFSRNKFLKACGVID